MLHEVSDLLQHALFYHPNHSLAHAQHAVNLLDSQPVENVGHESLETHVFDARDILRPFEIIRSAVCAAFAGVVYNCPYCQSSAGR